MKAFWRDIGKQTVIGLAVVGVLCLLGVTSFWAALAGLFVLDVVFLVRLHRPARRMRRVTGYSPRHMFLN